MKPALLKPAERLHPMAVEYLNLMQRVLLNTIYEDPPSDPWWDGKFAYKVRARGRDWPSQAHTMIGIPRLANFRFTIESVIRDNVPGDILEAGVWRGGACIMARAILKAYGVTDRTVWLADSFEGLPPPDPRYPLDSESRFHTYQELRVTVEQVQANFGKFDLLDDQVRFLKGWFKDTLARSPIEKLAVLRLDGDMYQSTFETLAALYDKVQPGGFIIVDDYNIASCKQAVDDFRAQRTIGDPIRRIDGFGVFWQKTG